MTALHYIIGILNCILLVSVAVWLINDVTRDYRVHKRKKK